MSQDDIEAGSNQGGPRPKPDDPNAQPENTDPPPTASTSRPSLEDEPGDDDT